MSLFSNFPQGGKKAGVQSISDGGTGATTAEAALANLGGFPKADGEALKTRIQPINLGGTGASEANQARQNLGAAAVKEMTKAQYDALATIDPTIFYALTDVEADGVKIEVGSYVGTGTYGSSNKNSIPINKTTQLVVVQAADHTKLGGYGYYWMLCIRGNTTSSNSSPSTSNLAKYVNTLEWDEETLSWYNDNYEGDQLNMSGTMYKYISIG